MCTLNTSPSINSVSTDTSNSRVIDVSGYTWLPYHQIYVTIWDTTTGQQAGYAFGSSGWDGHFNVGVTVPNFDGACYYPRGYSGGSDPLDVQVYDYQSGRWSNVVPVAPATCWNW